MDSEIAGKGDGLAFMVAQAVGAGVNSPAGRSGLAGSRFIAGAKEGKIAFSYQLAQM